MGSVRENQLKWADKRAKRLPKNLLSARKLDYAPTVKRAQSDDKRLTTRAAFLSTTGARPTQDEFERILGNNDLVDEFYFERALLAAQPVCRIIIRSESGHIRGHATGFMVSPRLMITNHHVFGTPEEAAPSLAEFNYRLDIAGNPEKSFRFKLRPDQYFFCNETLDFSLVSVEPSSLDDGVSLSTFGYHQLIPQSGKVIRKEWMTIIQHPSGAPRQWAIRENQCIDDADPDVIWYMSDTAKGSSGAPVLNDSFQVVALHHSGVAKKSADGKYVLRNGQKVSDIADVDDSLVDWIANAGIRVSRICACIDARALERFGHIQELQGTRSEGGILANAIQNPDGEQFMNIKKIGSQSGSQRITLGTLVLELNGGFLSGQGIAVSPQPDPNPVVVDDSGGAVEGLKEPIIDTNYRGRKGFNETFLEKKTPLLTVTDKSLIAPTTSGGTILHYQHFSVVMHKTRKLAIYTASNVDGSPKAKKPEAGKKYTRDALTGLSKNDQEKWVLDPRMDAQYQIPDAFYTKDNGAFDKGHIVRREDVCWGKSFREVQRANGDTFHVTNCSPQRGNFNQSGKSGIWGQLENYIGAQADAEKFCIFAGPVLHADDKIFSGTERVQIPVQFWKVVCAIAQKKLQVFAFILEQSTKGLPLEFQVDAEWKSTQVTLTELEKELDIVKFPAVYHKADQG